MTIRTINGFQIYAVTRNEVEYKPSYFQQQAEKWVEGAKRDQLSEEELDALKKKYNSRNMSREETVALLGELVEAGIMTRSTARDIYCGAVPLDVSKINHRYLSGDADQKQRFDEQRPESSRCAGRPGCDVRHLRPVGLQKLV